MCIMYMFHVYMSVYIFMCLYVFVIEKLLPHSDFPYVKDY